VADHDQGNALAVRLAWALPTCLAGAALTSFAVSRLQAGAVPVVGSHLVATLPIVAGLAWAMGDPRRERWLWVVIWLVLPTLALYNLLADAHPIQPYGDYRWLERARGPLARWLGGYALLRWLAAALGKVPALVAWLAPRTVFVTLVRAAGIVVTAVASQWLLRRWPGRLSALLPTLVPVWLLFGAGHLEYYPLVAWAVPVTLLWCLEKPLAERAGWQIGVLAAALFPLLYIGFAPLAGCLLAAYALAAPLRRSAQAVAAALATALVGIEVFFPKGILAFFRVLPAQIPTGDRGLFPGYRGLSAGPNSTVFDWGYAFSRGHFADLTFMQVAGGGVLVPLLLVVGAALVARQRGSRLGRDLMDRRSWLVLGVLASYACYFLLMVPRLGPRDDLDLFFAFYLLLAALAGYLADRVRLRRLSAASLRLLVAALAIGAAGAGASLLLFRGVQMPSPVRASDGRQVVGALLEGGGQVSLDDLEDAVRRRAVELEWYAEDASIVGVGLTHDRWTAGTAPAAVRFHNTTDAPSRPRLRLVLSAPGGADRPIRVSIHSAGGSRELELARAAAEWVELQPVAAGEIAWVFVWVDRAWQAPAPDRRWLGVNVHRAELAPSSAAAPVGTG
jgi:hypothetical protein